MRLLIAALLLASAPAAAQTRNDVMTAESPLPPPPVAEQRPYSFERHGVTIQDPWHWLRDSSYPTVDQALPGQGMQGYSHMPLNFGDNSDFVSPIPGNYAYRIKVTDANGGTSTATIPFVAL